MGRLLYWEHGIVSVFGATKFAERGVICLLVLIPHPLSIFTLCRRGLKTLYECARHKANPQCHFSSLLFFIIMPLLSSQSVVGSSLQKQPQ